MVLTRSSSKHEDCSSSEATSQKVLVEAPAPSSSRKPASSRPPRSQSAPLEMNEGQHSLGAAGEQARESAGTTRLGITPLTTPSRRTRRKRSSMSEQHSDDGSNVSISSEGSAGSTEQQTASSSLVEGTPSGKSASTPARGRRRSASSSLVSPSPARITRAMRKAGVTTPKEVTALEVVPEQREEVEVEDPSVQSHGESIAPSKSPKTGATVEGVKNKPRTVAWSEKKASSQAAEAISLAVAESPKELKDSVLATKSPEKRPTVAEVPSPRKPEGSPQKKSPAQSAAIEELPVEEISSLAQGIADIISSPEKVDIEKSPQKTPKKQSAGDENSEALQQELSMQSPMEVGNNTETSSPRSSVKSPLLKSPTGKAVSELLQKDVIPVVEAATATDTTERGTPQKRKPDDEKLRECGKKSPEGKNKSEQVLGEVSAKDSTVESTEELTEMVKGDAERYAKDSEEMLDDNEEISGAIDISVPPMEKYQTPEDSTRQVAKKKSAPKISQKATKDVDEKPAAITKKNGVADEESA
ncbi:hypothetical protein COOONC_27788 [Cooperia oncophora]